VANKKKTVSIIKSHSDFVKIRNDGQSITVNRWLLVSFVKNEKEGLRVGWTIPSYIGGAVIRNRYKRWIRDNLKSVSEGLHKIPLDVNILLRRRDAEFYRNVTREVFNAALFEAFRRVEKANL
jgi:ribonuclease P protein component